MKTVASVLGIVPVPRLWPASTIVCVGSGPSLTLADCALIHQQHSAGAIHVIAINDAIIAVPFADVLYAADSKWWRWHQHFRTEDLPKLLYTCDSHARDWRPSVRVLKHTGVLGYDPAPDSVRTGGHGGYQALCVAAHLGATRILLYAYDMQPSATGQHHFFGEHPDGNHLKYAYRLGNYQSLVEPFAALGISVINASRRTALTAFPCQSLSDALSPA